MQMQPEVKRLSYSEIDKTFQNRKDIISETYASKIDVFQDIIELSFHLARVLNARFNEEYEATGKKMTGAEALIPILFERNNHYLIAVHELGLIGLSNPSYLNLRAIFEGITQIYLLHLTDKEADLFYKDQLERLNASEKKELRRDYNWLSQAKVRDILYSGTKKDDLKKLYSVLSNSTHPSVKGAMGDFTLKHNVVIDILDVSLILSVANLIAINESYFEKINEEEMDDIGEALDKVAKELNNEMREMIPNNPAVIEKLKIKF